MAPMAVAAIFCSIAAVGVLGRDVGRPVGVGRSGHVFAELGVTGVSGVIGVVGVAPLSA